MVELSSSIIRFFSIVFYISVLLGKISVNGTYTITKIHKYTKIGGYTENVIDGFKNKCIRIKFQVTETH